MNMALHVYENIMRMPDNLSEKYIIGHGASSTVYKCVLKNCKPVAIKRLYSHYPQSLKEFETKKRPLAESSIGTWLVCKDTPSLLPATCCFTITCRTEVSGIFFTVFRRRKKLDWDTRLKISLGATEGLTYLHHDCCPHIIHRDVKSSNILLDKDFEAHLTDFGIVKSLCPTKTHTSTHVMGTIGYIDPEYSRTSRLMEKTEVYSYGIVLLELLTGRKAVDNESNLLHLILSKAESNAVMDAADSEITSTCKDLADVKKVFKLALLCAKRQLSDRPTMHEMARVLCSLVPSPEPPKQLLGILPAHRSSLQVPCYMDKYSNLKLPHTVNFPSMTTSDAQLFLKFGEAISQNRDMGMDHSG